MDKIITDSEIISHQEAIQKKRLKKMIELQIIILNIY